jgi:hypothetical protein
MVPQELARACILLAMALLCEALTSDDFCRQTSYLQGPPLNDEFPQDRIVAIGDVHGSLSSLLHVLFKAGIVVSDSVCEWSSESPPTLLVQTGDVVDRGPSSLESWRCLSNLQAKSRLMGAKHNVVRLLGNHELLWLIGDTVYKNTAHDTPDVVKELTQQIKEDIMAGNVVGAFAVDPAFKGHRILFSHAGLRPQMYNQLSARISQSRGERMTTPSARDLALFINTKLLFDVNRCAAIGARCMLKDAIYGVGAERGGYEVGGCFWTDWSVLQKSKPVDEGLTQVVGHSLEKSTIRSLPNVEAICIDVALYLNGQGYLELTSAGHFVAHEKRKRGWHARDLTQEACIRRTNETKRNEMKPANYSRFV